MLADELFTNLNRRQSMLLLIAVSYGGSESLPVLEHASEEDSDVLRDRAAKLLTIPREQRIQFLVQEMKRLVVGRQGGDLRGASAELVAAALKGERPALAEVLLRALPASLADQVRNEIPPSSVTLLREVRPDLLAAIRWYFERRLAELAPRGSTFLFADVQSLPAKDLASLADQLGAPEVGRSLAALSDEDRQGWLAELTSEQRSLAVRAVSTEEASGLEPAAANDLLERIAPPDIRYRVRHAGVRRIVRACLADSAESAGRLVERHHDDLGRMLVAAMRAERAAGRSGGAERLQAEIVRGLDQLVSRGVIERPVRLKSPAALRQRLSGKPSGRDTLPPLADAAPAGESAVGSPPKRVSAAREHPAVLPPRGRSGGLRPRVISRGRGKKPSGGGDAE